MNVEPTYKLMDPPIKCWRFRNEQDAMACIACLAADTSKAIPVTIAKEDGNMGINPDYENAPFEVQFGGLTSTSGKLINLHE